MDLTDSSFATSRCSSRSNPPCESSSSFNADVVVVLEFVKAAAALVGVGACSSLAVLLLETAILAAEILVESDDCFEATSALDVDDVTVSEVDVVVIGVVSWLLILVVVVVAVALDGLEPVDFCDVPRRELIEVEMSQIQACIHAYI